MSKIQITILKDRGYIFNADDYMRMRSEHRIIGHLVGAAPQCPRNPTVHGLPAILSPCEQRLLLDEHLAERLPGDRLCAAPTEADQSAHAAAIAHSLADQLAHLRAVKLEESRKQIGRIVEGKRKKLAAAGRHKEAEELDEERALAEIGELYVFNPANALLQIPTAGRIGGLVEEEKEKATTEVDRMETEDDQDAIPADDLKYRVFCDLWRRGKYVTPGDTFGGTFLVYPGDPAMYHASHIVHCLPDGAGSRVDAQQLVAGGRLSVLVNKLCVFAFDERRVDGTTELRYQTVEWEGKVADVGGDEEEEVK